MSLLIAILAALALAFAWNMMWRKTLLDTSRDKLFDLRDDSRQWFIDNDYPLDHKIYQSLRTLLNSHLRQMEDLTITHYLVTLHTLENSSQCRKKTEEYFRKNFWTEDKLVRDYVESIRTKASFVVMEHMMKGSLLFTVVVFTVLPFFIIFKIIKGLMLALLDSNRWEKLGINRRSVLASVVASIAAIVVSFPCRPITSSPSMKRIFNQEQVEYYSSRS